MSVRRHGAAVGRGWYLAPAMVLGALVLSTLATPANPAAAQGDTAAVLDAACLTGSPVPDASPAPDVPPPGTRTITDTTGTSFRLTDIAVGEEPAYLAVDAEDAYGRAFLAVRSAGEVMTVYGRSPGLQIACRLPVGGQPNGVAVDAVAGHVLVTDQAAPRLLVLQARTDPTAVLASIDLPGVPARVAIDGIDRTAYVTLPELGQVAVLVPGRTPGVWELRATVDAGSFPTFLAVDPVRERLLVGAQGQSGDTQGDAGLGRLLVFDTSSGPPVLAGEPLDTSVPTGILIDPVSGSALVLENGADRLATVEFAADGTPTITRQALPHGEGTQNLNPVDLVLMPGEREVVVTQSAEVVPSIGGHLDVFALDDQGRATFTRSIPSAQRTRGIALDPVTGRVLVADVTNGRLAAYEIDRPSVPPPPPTTIAESLPSPLDISLAPEDLVRTVGLSLLVLLLVGAPTPLFNETLESNLATIQGWFSRLLPGGGSGEAARRGRRFVDRSRRFTSGILGLAVYVAAAALIVSFLSPGFPAENGLLVFGVAAFGLVVATLADIMPGDRYVVSRYRSHGTIRVAIWTLVLAAICVLISRLAGLNPGYVYGIIGTFAFRVALTRADVGRMEALGAVSLLVLALAAWFARIPFEPTPGVPLSGPALIINSGLVGIFVLAVESLVFGLIPIRFLPGSRLLAWSRWRWLLLWGAGLALFAHVLIYPVTVAQPSPDPAALTTTLIGVTIYGAVAVGFWAYFRRRGPAEAG